MQIIERVTPAELRTWKRWVNTLESMLWLVQTAPLRAQSARRSINAEDRSLLVYLNELISQGRQLTNEPVFNWQMRCFEALTSSSRAGTTASSGVAAARSSRSG